MQITWWAASVSNILPLADGLLNTRNGDIWISRSLSREDHIHPLLRLSNVALPPFLLWWWFSLNSQTIYRTYTTEETLEYQVQIVVNSPTVWPRKTIVAPNIPWYTLTKFEYNWVYNGITTQYAWANFMYLWTLYFSPQLPNQLHYVDVSLTYILN